MRPSGPDTVPESRPVAACPKASVAIVITLKQSKKDRKSFTSIVLHTFSLKVVNAQTDARRGSAKSVATDMPARTAAMFGTYSEARMLEVWRSWVAREKSHIVLSAVSAYLRVLCVKVLFHAEDAEIRRGPLRKP